MRYSLRTLLERTGLLLLLGGWLGIVACNELAGMGQVLPVGYGLFAISVVGGVVIIVSQRLCRKPKD